ncbi:MAG: DUF411 domain-containing protein [Vicinamibacterales bacterium]
MAHIQRAGFQVEATNVSDQQLAAMSKQGGIPEDASSCHTAKVAGYTIEGHVPAEDITRLLAEKPAGVIGLAVPGMPVGSPGMEQGGQREPYQTLAILKDGKTRVFATHR